MPFPKRVDVLDHVRELGSSERLFDVLDQLLVG